LVGLAVWGGGGWGLGKVKPILTSAFVGVALIAAALMFPVPPVAFVSLGDIVSSRTDMGEAAAVSRWQLLPKLWEKIRERPITGSGFGVTVTYESKDPRVIEKTGGTGIYRTYAFEWGWLDFWLKFGILGIPLMLWVVVWLGWRIWRLDEPRWLRVGAVVSLAALVVLHFFTPYLNHPLGFAFIFLGEGLIMTSKIYAQRTK
jgi:O-antigen ligase